MAIRSPPAKSAADRQSPTRAESWEKTNYGARLSISYIGRQDQIFLKLHAAVDRDGGRHLQNLLDLEPTADELLDAAKWTRTQDPSEAFLMLLGKMLKYMIYTGLRRSELSGLKWGDFDFSADPPQLRVPSSLSKNRKESTHFLRPELADAMLGVRPADTNPEAWVFRGTIPRIPTFKARPGRSGDPIQGRPGAPRRPARAAQNLRHLAGSQRSLPPGCDGADAAQRHEAHHGRVHGRRAASDH